MKKIVLGTFFIGCSVMAYDYGYKNPYSNNNYNNNNSEYKYQGSSGTKYKYDLSNPADKIKYSVDVGAQLKDSINVNPRVGIDRGMGQYGGGIQDY